MTETRYAESAYMDSIQKFTAALDSSNLTAEQKNDIAHIFETIDADSDSASAFVDAAIRAIGHILNEEPSLLAEAFEVIACASSYYKIYW